MTTTAPEGVLARNMSFPGYSDRGGMPGGTQIMMHRGHAFIGKNEGVSILDVRDLRQPKADGWLDGDPNSWHIHLQAHDALLLVIDSVDFYMVKPEERDYYGRSMPGVRSSLCGMRVYDISEPSSPRRIGYLEVEGCGLHRIWYDGGRYVYAYGAWRDGGFTILDVHDPSHPELIVHRNWCSPYGGGTHSCLPLHDRDLLLVADEAVLDNCADGMKYTWVFDLRERSHPVSISTLPTPTEREYPKEPGHFGPHNLHENREGSFVSSTRVWATYQNAGLRLFDISDPYRPGELGYFVPPPPSA